jgi:hypothetical protein
VLERPAKIIASGDNFLIISAGYLDTESEIKKF